MPARSSICDSPASINTCPPPAATTRPSRGDLTVFGRKPRPTAIVAPARILSPAWQWINLSAASAEILSVRATSRKICSRAQVASATISPGHHLLAQAHQYFAFHGQYALAYNGRQGQDVMNRSQCHFSLRPSTATS